MAHRYEPCQPEIYLRDHETSVRMLRKLVKSPSETDQAACGACAPGDSCSCAVVSCSQCLALTLQ